jgi:hypothetical protein
MGRYVRFPSGRWCREMSCSWKKAICLQQPLRYRICADARMVSAQSLYVDVSVLTGESLPVARNAEPVVTEKMHASDASNLVFVGSTVAAGRGLAVVYATGTHTELQAMNSAILATGSDCHPDGNLSSSNNCYASSDRGLSVW